MDFLLMCIGFAIACIGFAHICWQTVTKIHRLRGSNAELEAYQRLRAEDIMALGQEVGALRAALAEAEKVLKDIIKIDTRRYEDDDQTFVYDGPAGKVASDALSKLRSVKENANGE